MVSFISSLAESVYENINPSYLEKKEKIKDKIQAIRIESLATLIGSIALCILGIAITGSGAMSGLPIISVSLPLSYLSFNIYQICKNGEEIINNPIAYINLSLSLDEEKFKRKLSERTICFSWILNYAFKKAPQLKKIASYIIH